MEDSVAGKLIRMQDRPGGAASGLRTELRPGRWAVTTAGFDPYLQLVGGDPWGTPTFTGLLVPQTPTPLASPQLRYLFLLARAQFNPKERVKLVGLKLYADLMGFTAGEGVLAGGPYFLPITSPMWRGFPDANISFHVRVIAKTFRSHRNPLNAPGLMFRDSDTPAQLYETLAPYSPPNAGRPWGKPIASDLGNIHEMRYPWRDSQSETELDIPVPPTSDLGVFCSVAQHSPLIGQPTFTTAQAAAAAPEDRFWAAFSAVQYGRVAASMIFEEDWGKGYGDRYGDDEGLWSERR